LGWLGYFDAWVAVGLLAVAYSPSRAGVVLACLLTPWIDERFVLGLPVALAVRGCRFAPAAFHWWPWFRREAVPPLALVTAYAIIRLQLGGTGASQTVSQYLHTFVFERRVASTRLLFGAWEGLRVGWVLVFAAIVGLGAHSSSRPPRAGLWLGVLTLLAVLGGLFTAMDLSRSMMLAIPVLPLGWLHLARTAAWRRFWGATFCASAALALPATHVMSDRLVPVDQLWSPPYALLAATTNIGSAHVRGDGIPADATTAVHWFQKAAAHGFVDAEFNLGVMYSRGEGMPRDATAAFDWYLRAANQGDAIAQSMVGTAYFRGDGVAKDQVAAARWFERAARQGDLDAQHNLGVIYASGLGVPRNLTRAVQWSRTAAGRNHAAAQVLLGRCYQNGEGVPRDPVLAGAWFALAAGQGYEAGLNHHRMLETTLTPAQRTAVSQAALALAKEINANR
jgi:TPR repeat protein